MNSKFLKTEFENIELEVKPAIVGGLAGNQANFFLAIAGRLLQ
jgi:hypothetical protein